VLVKIAKSEPGRCEGAARPGEGMDMNGRIRLGSIFVTTVMATVLTLFSGASAEAARTCGSKALAHRGATSGSIDENTLKAVERAHKLGAWVEGDVFLTRDKGFVIIHNRSLRPTTNCTGLVTNRTLANIQRHCHTTPNHQPIPSAFRLFQTIAHNRGQILNLEVKGPGWYAGNNRPLVRLRNAAAAAGALKRVYFSNDTTYRILTALHHSAPNARTAWKPSGRERRFTVRHARNLSADAVMARSSQWASGSHKARSFQRAGFRIWGRLADNKAGWKRNWRLGVNAQLTDRPGQFRTWCRHVR